jgi:multidrug efflux pump
MNFSRFFIDRPIFAGVLSTLIFVAGLLSLPALPISEYPEVAPPTVVVRAQYPGANPKVIAETVSTPIEEQINGVEGMLYMSSQATTDGLMTLNVTFRLGTDPDKAQQLVQNRVTQAEPRLPSEVRTLGITTIKSAPDLTMVVHLLSPNGRYDMTYLRNYAVLNVKDRLARIEGVGQVQLFGSGDYSMRVWLDPQKVAERGAVGRRRGARDPGPERPGGGWRRRVIAKRGRARFTALHQRTGAAADRAGVRRNHRQERRQWRSHKAARYRPDRAWRRGLFAALASG